MGEAKRGEAVSSRPSRQHRNLLTAEKQQQVTQVMQKEEVRIYQPVEKQKSPINYVQVSSSHHHHIVRDKPSCVHVRVLAWSRCMLRSQPTHATGLLWVVSQKGELRARRLRESSPGQHPSCASSSDTP